MDVPPSPFVRAERTFWTVWKYITEVVGRFLRPVATDIVNNDNDTSSGQEHTADREADNGSDRDSDAKGVGADEKQTAFAEASVVNATRPVVAWEQPTITTGSGPEKEDAQYTIEFSRGGDSHASEEGEGTTEEQVALTEDGETGRHVTQDVSGTEEEERDEIDDEELHLCGKDEIKIAEPDETNEHEIITGSPSISDAASSEDVGEMVINSGREEETDKAMTPIPDDQHKVDEAMMTQFQAMDGEETKEVLFEDAQGDLKDPHTVGCSEVEEKAGKWRMFKDTSPEEENNMYVEDSRRQKNEEDGGVTYEAALGEETEGRGGVLELTSDFPITGKENSFKPDEGSVEPVTEVQEPLVICKEVSFEDSAVMRGPGIVAPEAAIHAELQMTYNKRGIVSVDEITVVVQEQMMGEGIDRNEDNKVEDQNEDRSSVVERKKWGIKTAEENDREEEVITNKILNTLIEQEDCLKAVREDSKEEHMITEHVGVCERVTEDVEIELRRAGLEDGDQDDEMKVLVTVTKACEEEAFEKASAEVSGPSVNLETMIANETELTGIAISIDERFDDAEKDKIEEETVSRKEERVSNMEETLAPIAVTVKIESNNTVEESGELKDISPGICVGPVVVPQEPGSGACDETKEEVPEYNNGHELDEDAKQRILEAGDYEEIWTTQLPEKLESEEPESLENIVGDFEAGHLLASEHKEEEQDSKSENTEHIQKKNLDMVVEGQTEILCFTDTELPRDTEKLSADLMNGTAQLLGSSFVAEVGPQAASVKTEPRQSENASESGTVSVDETRGTEAELCDNTGEPLAELGLDEELTKSAEPEAGGTSRMEDDPVIEINVQNEKTTAEIEEDVVGLLEETEDSSETELKNTTEAGLSDESMDAEASEEKVAPESIVETTLMEPLIHTGLKLLADEDLQDREIEIQDARFEMEGISDSGTVVKAAENESDNENDSEGFNMQTIDTTAGLFKENDGIENALVVGSEPPRDNAELSVESVETKHELSEKPFQASNQEEMTDTELCDESMEVESEPEDEVSISKGSERDGLAESMIELMGNDAEETGKPVIGHGNETDEETLDMWLETVLSEDRDDAEPEILIESTEREPVEESEPGLQRDVETPPSDEGPDEKLPEKTEEEQSVESSTEEKLKTESGSVSEAEISDTSPSAESGFSDQSIGVGPVVAPQEPGSGACDETKAEVPEYNNGHELDEDAKQRILEAGDYEEIWTTQLPEKLESEEPESLENIVGDFEAGHLLASEHKEEEQDSKSENTEHIEKNLDMVVEGQTEILCFTDTELPRDTEKLSADLMNGTAQLLGSSFVAEVGPQAASVKTEPRQSENASESGTVSVDETRGTEAELCDNTGEPLAELGLDGELTKSAEPEAGGTSRMEDDPVIEINVQNEKTTAEIEEDVVGLLEETADSSETELKTTTEAGLSDESMDAEASEEKVAPESIVETTLMEPLIHTGLKLLADEDLQDREIEIQDARFEMEGISDSGTVVKAAENESDNENDSEGFNMQTVDTTAGLFKENDGIENALVVGSEPPRDNAELSVESVETKHELSEKPFQASNQEEMTDTELCDESMEVESEPEDEVSISKGSERDGLAESMIELMGNDAEETGKPVIGHGNETDEETLDMWLETVLSEDRDDAEPEILIESTEREPVEESEPGLQRDVETPPSDEGPDEKLPEKTEEEQSVESSTEEKLKTESGSVSEAEISDTSPSAESGFSDQSIGVGPVVAPQEPGSGACDETKEEVPEYNNGHELDEDAKQRILEAGDYEEIWTTQLPEKLESEEPESLENIVGDFEAGHLLASEHKEEEQDSKSENTEHIEKNLDMVVEGQTEILCFTDTELPRDTEKLSADLMNGTAQLLGSSFVAEVGPQAASVKTEPRQSENASESGTVSVDETRGTEAELCDNTGEPLAELGLDGELTKSAEPEAGGTSRMEDDPVIEINVQNEKTTAEIEEDVVGLLEETADSSETELKTTTEAGLSDESMDAEASEEKVAPESIVETTLMEPLIHTGLKLLADEDLQDREIEIQDARFEMEGISDSGTVVKAAENESDNENDSEGFNMQTVDTTAGLFKENDGIENALVVGSEPPRDNAELSVESVETKHELSEKPFQASNQEEMTDTELCDESMEVESEPEDEVSISKGSERDGLAESMIELMGNDAEETGKPVIGHGNETDEETLDMWLETVLSEDRDDAEPEILIESTEREPVEESELGLQRDVETPPSDESPDEKLPEKTEEEQSVESSTEEKLKTESGSVSEAEISDTSPSAESGFSDQSIGELDPPENKAQQLKFAGSGLFQGILETADSVSETAETWISDLSAKPSETEDRLIEQTGEAEQSYVEEDQFAYAIPVPGISQTRAVLSEAKHNESADVSQENREPEKMESVETETGLRNEIIPEVSDSGLSDQTDGREAKGTEAKSPTEMDALFRDYPVEIKDEPLEKTGSNILNEIQEDDSALSNETEETESVLLREGSEPEALLGERVVSEESGLLGETDLESHNQFSRSKVPLLDKAQRGRSEETDGSLPGLNTEETTEALLSSPPRATSGDQLEVDASILDFTPQKSRIAVKNPLVRPPKDPRTLLQMPSVEPTPQTPSGHLPVKGLAGVPMGGLGIGIKLPGLGAGFPVLKKTQKRVRDENNTESLSQQTSEAEAEKRDESPKEEEAERKPKWMPPRHPGFGNPLMSELKTKLKKTTKE